MLPLFGFAEDVFWVKETFFRPKDFRRAVFCEPAVFWILLAELDLFLAVFIVVVCLGRLPYCDPDDVFLLVFFECSEVRINRLNWKQRVLVDDL
jgi:hypothetical protein